MTTQELDKLPDSSNSPENLLAQIASGDRKSEQELISRHWRGLYFILCRRTNDPELAADLAQDTFLIVIEKARNGGIEKPKGFAGFIRQVGINLMKAHYRKEKRRSTDINSEIDIQIPDDSPTLYRQLHSENMLKLVEQLMEELSVERDRTILKCHFIYEKEKAAICQDLGLSPEHFDRVLQRARTRLKQLINNRMHAESAGKLSSNLLGTSLLVVLMLTSLLVLKESEGLFDSQVREIQNQRHLSSHRSAKSLFPLGRRFETDDCSRGYYCYG